MQTAFTLHQFVAFLRCNGKADATADSVRASLKRHGHAYGVTPRRLPGGQYLFPAPETYLALGLIPPAGREVTLMRDVLQSRGLDALAAHNAAEALLTQDPPGATGKERIASIWPDVDATVALIEALCSRVGSALADEELCTDDDRRRFEAAIEKLRAVCEFEHTPLGWLLPLGRRA